MELCTFCHEIYVKKDLICDKCKLLIESNDYINRKYGIDVITNDFFITFELIFDEAKRFLDFTNISYICENNKFYLVVFSVKSKDGKEQFRKIFKNFLDAYIQMENLNNELLEKKEEIKLSFLHIDFNLEDPKIEIQTSKNKTSKK